MAGLIYENYLQGRKKSIWLSVSADLKLDAERDLKDIGASQIKVHALNKLKYAKISSTENGKIKKGVIFSTYSSLISESTSAKGACKSRIGQLVQWCGEDFDGVIIFDECHKAKNLIPEKVRFIVRLVLIGFLVLTNQFTFYHRAKAAPTNPPRPALESRNSRIACQRRASSTPVRPAPASRVTWPTWSDWVSSDLTVWRFATAVTNRPTLHAFRSLGRRYTVQRILRFQFDRRSAWRRRYGVGCDRHETERPIHRQATQLQGRRF